MSFEIKVPVVAFTRAKERKHGWKGVNCFIDLPETGSHDAVFNYIYLQLVFIKSGAPHVDTLAVNATLSFLKQSAGRVVVLVYPTGSFDIGLKRTQCDLGRSMTLGTQRGIEAGKRRAQLEAKEQCTND